MPSFQCAVGSVPRGQQAEVPGSAYQEGRARMEANSLSPRKQERETIGKPKRRRVAVSVAYPIHSQ